LIIHWELPTFHDLFKIAQMYTKKTLMGLGKKEYVL